MDMYKLEKGCTKLSFAIFLYVFTNFDEFLNPRRDVEILFVLALIFISVNSSTSSLHRELKLPLSLLTAMILIGATSYAVVMTVDVPYDRLRQDQYIPLYLSSCLTLMASYAIFVKKEKEE